MKGVANRENDDRMDAEAGRCPCSPNTNLPNTATHWPTSVSMSVSGTGREAVARAAWFRVPRANF